MRDLLTSKEAAIHLRTVEDNLRHWRCRGVGPKCIRINGRIFYRLRDLEHSCN